MAVRQTTPVTATRSTLTVRPVNTRPSTADVASRTESRPNTASHNNHRAAHTQRRAARSHQNQRRGPNNSRRAMPPSSSLGARSGLAAVPSEAVASQPFFSEGGLLALGGRRQQRAAERRRRREQNRNRRTAAVAGGDTSPRSEDGGSPTGAGGKKNNKKKNGGGGWVSTEFVPDEGYDTDLECPVCTGTFHTPLVLGCDHIFCQQCLYRLTSVQDCRCKRCFKCPLCRQRITSVKRAESTLTHAAANVKGRCVLVGMAALCGGEQCPWSGRMEEFPAHRRDAHHTEAPPRPRHGLGALGDEWSVAQDFEFCQD